VGGKVYPPCGRCREFIYRINYDNLDTEILVDDNKVVKLSEILPYRYD
jgi:cytidine deaminase